MEMTLEQYILNPMGKNNAVLNATAREAIRASYTQKFNAILLREKGRINYRLYKDTKNNRYYAHIKIPSETVENFYYDTVLEFYTNEDVEEAGKNLFKYFVNFYSNDPAFVYNYAYVFEKNKMFITQLRSKMSKVAITTAAKEKNPSNQVGYVKSIYFAYLMMQNKSLNKIDRFNGEAIELDINYLISQVTDADTKISEREEAGKKVTKKPRKQNDENRIVSNRDRNASLGVSKVGRIGGVNKTGNTTGKIKSVKNTKRK